MYHTTRLINVPAWIPAPLGLIYIDKVFILPVGDIHEGMVLGYHRCCRGLLVSVHGDNGLHRAIEDLATLSQTLPSLLVPSIENEEVGRIPSTRNG
jgi:hypothetical protein